MKFLKKIKAYEDNEITDMQVGNVQYDNWGDENDPSSDWSILNKEATFSHKEECEFIVALAGVLPKLSKEGMDVLKQAKADGYKYVCFYA